MIHKNIQKVNVSTKKIQKYLGLTYRTILTCPQFGSKSCYFTENVCASREERMIPSTPWVNSENPCDFEEITKYI